MRLVGRVVYGIVCVWLVVSLAVWFVSNLDEPSSVEREACQEYVSAEYANAVREGYTPPPMPDCDP